MDNNIELRLGDALVIKSLVGGLIVEGILPIWVDSFCKCVMISASNLNVGVLRIPSSASTADLLRMLVALRRDGLSVIMAEFAPAMKLAIAGDLKWTQWIILIEDLPKLFAQERGTDLDISLGELCFSGEKEDFLEYYLISPAIGSELPLRWNSMSLSERATRILFNQVLAVDEALLTAESYWSFMNRTEVNVTSVISASVLWCTRAQCYRSRMAHIVRNQSSRTTAIDHTLFPFVKSAEDRSQLSTLNEPHRALLGRLSDIHASSNVVHRAEWLTARIPPGRSVIWSDRYIFKLWPQRLAAFVNRLLALTRHSESRVTLAVGDGRGDAGWADFVRVVKNAKVTNPTFDARIMTQEAWNHLHDRHLYVLDTGQILVLPTADRLVGQLALNNYVESEMVSDHSLCATVANLVQDCNLVF